MKRLLSIVAIMFALTVNAQQVTRMLFIFDASNSMNGKWEGATKIERAREILTKTINELEDIPDLELALRVYGHQSPITPTSQDCNDTKLEVPFEANNHAKIINFIQNVEPKGTTPIARSLEEASKDFPDKTTKNVIVLITDGLEACEGFPCEVAKVLKSKGINVTPFVVGLGIDLAYLSDFNCIGRFYEASTMASFEKVMQSVISDALNSTTLQIDLNDITGKETETNTTVHFYEAGTKNLKYTFMHTLNIEGNPDTISVVDPKLKYDVVANTLPKVEIKNVTIIKGRHNHVDLNTPQGALGVKIKGKTTRYNVPIIVTQKGKCETLNVQNADELQKYIVGDYEVEVMTLPRIYKNDITIEQSVYSYITVPGSGQFSYQNYKPIIGQIFLKMPSGEHVWVCDINSTNRNDEKHLQPGNYRVVYRNTQATSTDYTLFKDFQINSGDRVYLKL